VALRVQSDLSRERSSLFLQDSNLSREYSNLSREYSDLSPVVRQEDNSLYGVVRKVDGDIEPCVQSNPEPVLVLPNPEPVLVLPNPEAVMNPEQVLVLKDESQSSVRLQEEACYNVKTGQNSLQGMRGKMASVEVQIGRHCVLDSYEDYETAALNYHKDMLVESNEDYPDTSFH